MQLSPFTVPTLPYSPAYEECCSVCRQCRTSPPLHSKGRSSRSGSCRYGPAISVSLSRQGKLPMLCLVAWQQSPAPLQHAPQRLHGCLQGRASAVGQVLYGTYAIPSSSDQPIDIVINPRGDEARSVQRYTAVSSPHHLPNTPRASGCAEQCEAHATHFRICSQRNLLEDQAKRAESKARLCAAAGCGTQAIACAR